MVLPIQNPTRAAFNPLLFWEHVAVRPADPYDDADPEAGVEDGAGGAGAGAGAGAGRGGAGAASSSSSSSSSAAGSRFRRGGNVLGVSPDGTFAQLLVQVRRRLVKKRTYARLPLTLGPGLHVGVALYNNVYPARKPTAKQLFAETKQPVKTESRYIDAGTGEPLADHDLMLTHKVGDTSVYFTPAENKAIRAVSGKGRGIELIGFQARETLRDIDTLRPPYLVYPTERDVEGSTTLFRALWQRMIDRRLVAIALLTARENMAARIVALMPEQERVDASSGQQLAPPGLYALALPFADDVRAVHATAGADASASAGSKAAEGTARELVARLKAHDAAARPYRLHDPDSMPQNPALLRFYSGLEALALNRMEADVEDKARAPVEEHEGVMGELAARFLAETGLASMGSGAAGGAAKRGRGKAAAAAAAAVGDDEGAAAPPAKKPRAKKAAAAAADEDGALDDDEGEEGGKGRGGGGRGRGRGRGRGKG